MSGSDAHGPVSGRKGMAITAIFALAYCTALVSATLLTSGASQAIGFAGPLTLPPLRHLIRDVKTWLASWAPLSDMPKAERLQLLLEENQWKNSLVMWAFPEEMREAMPHLVQTWLRCVVLCAAVYFAVGAIWCYYAYYCFGDKLFRPGTIPAFADTLEQIKVSVLAIPMYSLLPMITEAMAEWGWTMAYPRIENVGLPMYALYFVLYMASVEFGVYWMHRGLHEIKWGYRWLHNIHHKYNKEHTLSPFAGLAFHPLDGILQAVPYTWTMFFCPMHFLTHEILLFATGVWTANIHDNIHGKVWPIMGAGYHTIHHTDYKHNYGHYFVFMDQLFGTMLTPEEEKDQLEQKEQQRQQQQIQADKAAEVQPAVTKAAVQPAVTRADVTAVATSSSSTTSSSTITTRSSARRSAQKAQ